jgi:hypothetical protein
MEKANQDIRKMIRDSGLKYWQVAERYGVNDGNFSRKLRTELPDKEKVKILMIISELNGLKGEAENGK